MTALALAALALAADPGWHAALAPGMAEARKSGKPLFVVFRCQP